MDCCGAGNLPASITLMYEREMRTEVLCVFQYLDTLQKRKRKRRKKQQEEKKEKKQKEEREKGDNKKENGTEK